MSSKIFPKILICDDDPSIHDAAKMYLSKKFLVISCYTVMEAKKYLLTNKIDAVVIDLNFEGQEYDGLSLITFVSQKLPQLDMFVLSGDKNTERVVEVAQMPNITFIVKGESCFQKLLDVMIKKLITPNEDQSIGPEMKLLLANLERIISSNTKSPILITGETGAGKEFLADIIATRFGKPMKAVNMANVSKETAESILFGHEKGAFTGANASKIGLFEAANHGILFLDEIGECDLTVQAKILRAIQEREIQPLGSTKTIKVNVQLIAATHKNLHDQCLKNQFRLDLLQRMNTFTIEIPPLRERPLEIESLSQKFLADYSSGRMKLSSISFEVLKKYDFPGNIRELKSIMERVAIYSKKNEVDSQTLEHCIFLGNPSFKISDIVAKKNFNEREILCQVLRDNRGNKNKAARILKMGRTSIYRKIEMFQIKEEEYV